MAPARTTSAEKNSNTEVQRVWSPSRRPERALEIEAISDDPPVRDRAIFDTYDARHMQRDIPANVFRRRGKVGAERTMLRHVKGDVGAARKETVEDEGALINDLPNVIAHPCIIAKYARCAR